MDLRGWKGTALFANKTESSSTDATNGTCNLRQIIESESITTSFSVGAVTNEELVVLAGICMHH